MDLDSQVNTLFMKSHSNMVQRAAMGWRMSARSGPRFKEALGGPAWDYRNIIEKLQVQKQQMPWAVLVVVHLSGMCQMWKKQRFIAFLVLDYSNPALLSLGRGRLSSSLVPVHSKANVGGLLIHDLNLALTEVRREG